MKIDAHQHFWQYDRVRDSWITDDMAVIQDDFMPKDLKPLLDQHGFDGCVAVQADQSEKENDFLLDLAQHNKFIKGVVGWVDLKNENLSERLLRYKQYAAFKGVRHILQAEPQGFMTDYKFINGLKKLYEHDLSYDILTHEKQLPEVVEFIAQLPEMRFVIDHISKPDIKQASIEHWAKYMKQISAHKNVYVKLSGMATEANWQTWTTTDLKPYIDFCLEYFGPQRLMFGSDWPVCNLVGSYNKIHQALLDCIGELSASEQNQIMGETALKFYHLS